MFVSIILMCARNVSRSLKISESRFFLTSPQVMIRDKLYQSLTRKQVISQRQPDNKKKDIKAYRPLNDNIPTK